MNDKNKRWFRGLLAVLVTCLIVFLSIGILTQTIKAFSSGVSGFSGASGADCNQCHTGGITPTVTLSGPTTVLTGELFTYTLTVAGGQELAAGLDVAVTSGVLTDTLAGGLYTQILSGEVTHENSDPIQKASPNYPNYGHDGGPKCIVSDCTQAPGGKVTFTFNWIAPNTAESVTMYGAGNSVDLSGDNSGDRAGVDSLTITVIDLATLTEKLYLPFVVKD